MAKIVKMWFCVMCLCSLSSDLIAQGSRNFFQNDSQPFYGGFLLGANISTVEGDTYGGYHKVGLNTGVTVYATILPSFLASMELIYSQKGSRGVKVAESYYAGTFVERYYLDLNYVEVPVVFHYLFTSQLSVGLGGSYAQLIKSKEEAVTDQPVSLRPDINVFRKEDYNFIFDGGFQIGDGLFFNARYQFSLATIRDWDRIPVGFGYGGAQYNNSFSFRLMYLLK
jgi:hypothetical protein